MWILSVCFVVCGVIVGYILTQKYKRPCVFYKEFLQLLLFIKNKIAYSKTNIYEILDEYVKTYSVKTAWVLALQDDFKNAFKNCKMQQEIVKFDIKTAKCSEIVLFFKNFGGLDYTRQLENLDVFLHKTQAEKEEAESVMQKMYPLVFKICILAGIMAAIVVL